MTPSATAMSSAAPPDLAIEPLPLHLVEQSVAARVVPPPADALDGSQRAALASSEPLSLLRVLGPEGVDGAAAGERAGRLIRELIAADHYQPCGTVFAVHEVSVDGHTQVGLVAGVPLMHVDQGRVRPHEQTRQDRQATLAAFLDAAAMDVSPVVLTYAAVDELEVVVREVMAGSPTLVFRGWGEITHRVWTVSDHSMKAAIQAAAGHIGEMTIVDGHHRVAAALASEGGGSRGAPHTLMAELVPDRDLRLYGFDRRVRLDDPQQGEDILARLAEVAQVTELGAETPDRPVGRHELLAGIAGRWVSARFPDPSGGLVGALPVALLQERVLGPLVGIEDPRTDPRLEHVAGVGSLDPLARSLREEPSVAFVPRAVTVAELQAAALAGQVLPPKSTYADPKPGPGIVIRLRDVG